MPPDADGAPGYAEPTIPFGKEAREIAGQVTAVVAVALSFGAFVSEVAEDTVATFVTVAGGVTLGPSLTTRLKAALPRSKTGFEHETVPPAPTEGVSARPPHRRRERDERGASGEGVGHRRVRRYGGTDVRRRDGVGEVRERRHRVRSVDLRHHRSAVPTTVLKHAVTSDSVACGGRICGAEDGFVLQIPQSGELYGVDEASAHYILESPKAWPYCAFDRKS